MTIIYVHAFFTLAAVPVGLNIFFKKTDKANDWRVDYE
jgi:hypothetical protein